MRYTQHFLNAFGNPVAMARVLSAMCSALCASGSATQPLEHDMAAFLAVLAQRGEAFLEVTLNDGRSSLYLWARRDGLTCQVQLTPSLHSATDLKQSWEDHCTSAVMLRHLGERPSARRMAA